MGKPLNLGGRLKYPVTIKKLLKRPGEEFVKQDPLFEYTFTSYNEVGDPFGETWREKQDIFAQWESTADGKIERWNVKEGMVIDHDMEFVEIEEGCSHAIQFAGLCAICGKDMNEISFSTEVMDSNRAQINMIHDQTHLTVSQDEASKAEEELQRRLLKHKKLSLVVDLDQTIIHACIEPTVGEWQRDVNSPNYEAVKDVKSFQLNDEGPRGVASGCWYYIKMRPGLKEFLDRISELYELHVYTMGTRAYAQNIAKIVDPERKLFGDRIISRDENGSMTAKSLARLFPVDTKMVVIIDDRADVWPKNRPNLIKVTPYDFFVGIGDINSSFLPKREDIPKPTSAVAKTQAIALKETTTNSTNEIEGLNIPSDITIDTSAIAPAAEDTENMPPREERSTTPTDEIPRVSALEELVSMGAGDNPIVHQAQVHEQEESLAKQVEDRPLLKLQQKLDEEDEEEGEEDADESSDTPKRDKNHEAARHNLLKDDDVELSYLGEHLTRVHKAFYDEYEGALREVQGGRLAQLRPGHKKKLPLKDDAADLKIVPDIGIVMPRLKSTTLGGTVIVLSGLVPLGFDTLKSEIAQQAMGFGAIISTKVNRKTTHVVVSTNRARTQKVRQAARYPHIKIVNQGWLFDSIQQWQQVDPTPYLIEVHRDNHAPVEGDPAFGQNDSDAADDASDSDSGSGYDDEDPEGVIPDEPLASPIEGLNDFDWGETNKELDDFLNETGSDDDSDAESTTSRSSTASQITENGLKRTHSSLNLQDDSDEESVNGSHVDKKRQLANARPPTSLKTVMKASGDDSESSLPTPDVTGGEENDEEKVPDSSAKGDDELDFDDADFEAEMEAELERGLSEET